MNATMLDLRVRDALQLLLDEKTARGEIAAPALLERQAAAFRDRFGPAVLAGLDGEALLRVLHGRDDPDRRCLAYWLEFKNDEEFSGPLFGSIVGGSALKFGIYQRVSDGAWVSGDSHNQRALPLSEAVSIARSQRDELIAGANVLGAWDSHAVLDADSQRLQQAMEAAAPQLSNSAWAHKYWLLLHPDRLDAFHSPRYQRFHLLKLLQMTPDGIGILDSTAPRFICAGRFVAAARSLGISPVTFCSLLALRHGSPRRYWKVGTTEGSSGDSQWEAMRDNGFVAIGWKDQIDDLSAQLGDDRAALKTRLAEQLIADNNAQNTSTRKAGEILNFALEIAEHDIVLATEGMTVLGIGRVTGLYRYDARFAFPHQRQVEWLWLEPWKLPDNEGPRTTVYELGRSAANLLEIEWRLSAATERGAPPLRATPTALPPLDPLTARVDAALQRKKQVILYGPPGTGKTFSARQAARELAARQMYRKRYADVVDETERKALVGDSGAVRLCSFHPGWGYEDFMEGLRPEARESGLVFTPRDGVFKRLCADARQAPSQPFYLIIDEINRGDLPRIFGELLTLIEHDKRGEKARLPVTGEMFEVPPNVYLIGTMNTADRSISLLDTALRRRFGFVELMPDSTLLAGRRVGNLPLGAWLDALNQRLRRYLKRDARSLQIGHAYLMPSQPISSVPEFARVLHDDIIPLLQEYCYDDFTALEAILGKGLVDAENGRLREELFNEKFEKELLQAVTFEELAAQLLDDESVKSDDETFAAEDAGGGAV